MNDEEYDKIVNTGNHWNFDGQVFTLYRFEFHDFVIDIIYSTKEIPNYGNLYHWVCDL